MAKHDIPPGAAKRDEPLDTMHLSMVDYERLAKLMDGKKMADRPTKRDRPQPPPAALPQDDTQLISAQQWNTPGGRAQYAENAQALWIARYNADSGTPGDREGRADVAVKAFRDRFDLDYAAQIAETETIWVTE